MATAGATVSLQVDRLLERLGHRLVRHLLAHRRAVAVAMVCVVVAAGAASSTLRVRNDLEAFFVADDPALLDWHAFRERFGTDEVVVVTVQAASSVCTPARRASLSELTSRLERIRGVERVQSLATMPVVTSDADGFSIAPVGERCASELADARARHGALARGVGRGDDTQVVWLWLTREATTDDERHRVLTEIQAATGLLSSTNTVKIVGGGVVWEALNALTVRDGAVFISLSALVLLVGVVGVTRRWLWGALAVFAVSCANTCVFAAMAVGGVPLNAVTVCLPGLVMALGVLDVMHLVFAVVDLPDDVTTADDPRIVSALSQVVVPGVFNVLTTVIGVLALLAATTAVTRQLGACSALGVVCAWTFTLGTTVVAMPWLLRRRPRRRPRHEPQVHGPALRSAHFAVQARVPVLVVASAIAATAIVGIAQIDVDTDTLGFLPAHHPVVLATRAVEAEVGPFIPLELDVAFAAPGEWRQAAVLNGVRAAADALVDARVSGAGAVVLGRAVSAVDLVVEADRALAPSATAPLTQERVDAALALLAVQAPEALRGLVSDDDRHLRVTVPVTLTTARGLVHAGDMAHRTLQQALPTVLRGDVRLTGYLPLYAQIVGALVHDQVWSFVGALVGIVAVLALLLRSWSLVTIAVLPNALPVVAVLGLMGWAGITLDVATVAIAATMFGVVVDDTVHTLFALRVGLSRLSPTAPARSVDEAIVAAVGHVGRAHLAGNLLLASSFLVLVAASARSLVVVGGLSAVAVLVAALAEVFVVPALASVLLARGRRP